MADEPLFWIHLNVDYPFNLTGVLYFPKIKQNIDLQRNKIQLYCNQVFVTDQVDNVVPEFLTLLHGVIDSPDIPLNVSRSYLQSDANVKKISTYITKKVADRLASLFKNNREDFEQKWADLSLFIHYGMLSQPDFYEKAQKFALFTDVDGKHYTYEEYKEHIKENQTDKEGNLIYLYASNTELQYAHIEAARAKGYNVLLMDGQLDAPMVSMLEQKFEKSRIVRVDGDVITRLIQKEDTTTEALTPAQASKLATAFEVTLPKMEKTELRVQTENLGADDAPIVVTQSEYMRRMKEMAQFQGGMSFYGEMPDMYNVVLNSDHALVRGVLNDLDANTAASLQPIENELRGLNARLQVLQQEQNAKKADEITEAERNDLEECRAAIAQEEAKKKDAIAAFAQQNQVIPQLIDLALLQSGLLKGAELNRFIKRSIDLMK
jgi:molecular chaperone HtpG